MTLTSPVALLQRDYGMHHRAALKAVESVHINLVWSPRWDPKIHASEDARMDMGIWVNHK